MNGGGIGEFNLQDAQAYAANAGAVGGAIDALKRHNGWQIFLALFYRKKKEIQAKEYGSDMAALAEFKGDRGAVQIIEDLFSEMDGLVEDASEAQRALGDITSEAAPPRGIMLIEAMEGSNRESA